GSDVADVTDDELTFIARTTRIASGALRAFVRSAIQANATNVPAEVFFGLARTGQPEELSAILSLEPATQRAALERALAMNVIPAELQAKLDELVAELQQATVTVALQPSADPSTPSLSALLQVATPSVDAHTKMLAAFVARPGTPEEAWEKLRADPS